MQGKREQVAVVAFHAKPAVALQPHVLWPARPSETYTPTGVVGQVVQLAAVEEVE